MLGDNHVEALIAPTGGPAWLIDPVNGDRGSGSPTTLPAVSGYPHLIPPTLTIREAAAPPITLRLTLIALGVGALVLIPSLAYLFRIFKSRPLAFEGLHEELQTREHEATPAASGSRRGPLHGSH